MIKPILASAAAFALALPATAMAQEPDSPPAPETAEESDDDGLDMNRRICKTYKVTGSRLAKRKVCRTALEWKQHEEETRKYAKQALDRHAAAAGNE